MARPSKHDGVVYQRGDSKIWWMRYRDISGARHLESTGTEDWSEAQRRLRERLQARDNRTLEVVRKGRAAHLSGLGGMVYGELLEAPDPCSEDPRSQHPRDEASSSYILIEFHAPEYLRNVIRIIMETGLRVYKELTPMKKDQVDLENAVAWIPDSKTPNGVAEPLTLLAVEAFRGQLAIGPGCLPVPQRQESNRAPDHAQDCLAEDPAACEDSVFLDLRSPFNVRDSA